MDSSLSVVTDDGDISWSDSHSLDSDDSNSMIMPVSPSWMGPMATNSHAIAPPSATMTFSHNGQLSPISTEMDGAVSRADNTCEGAAPSHDVVPLMDAGGSSASSVDSWSMGQDESDGLPAMSREGGESDFPWEHELDDEMMVPKLEPLDEEENFCLTDIQEAPLTPVADKTSSAPMQVKPKRPRGRPRKHPLNPVVSANKVTKGRSKTGCLTCRKRKKKCDEAKPRCMNCEKNAVVCEGYPEKQIWKSGRERAEEERLKSHNVPSITLQPLFHGLETTEDRIFWKHYNEHLSAVLTVEGEHKNAFRDMIVTIAVKHEGLMHSILALSSKHIDYDTPYGAKILSSADTTLDALHKRSDFHHECAVQKLIPNLDKPIDKSDPEFKTKLCARYAQILCLLLEALVDGNPRGDHRIYLGLYQNLLVAQPPPPEDPAFRAFVTEFFQYHIFADELIRHPDKEPGKPRLASETWEPSAPIHPPRLLGVADGLFNYLAQITSIRDTIRANLAEQNDPVVDYTSLYKAVDIEAGIKDWKPEWPRGDSRDRVSLLYAQMTWLYLLRTIKPPASSSHPTSLSSSSTSLPAIAMPTTIAVATLGSPASAATNTPPLSSSSASDSSSPHLPHRPWPPADNQQPPSLSDSHHHHRQHQPQPSLHRLPPSGGADDDTNDADMEHHEEEDEEDEAVLGHARRHSHAHVHADSPPPIRLPPGQDHRISVAVEESLAILEGFKPADPAQTLLLMPCLVIGTVCFAPHQRARVRAAVRVVRGYRGLRNADRVSELLEEVWRAMDRGDWMAVWDWQGVARGMGLDFLCS